MAHGGKRKNAGRPPGTPAKLDKEAREKAKAEGIQPLDVLLTLIKNEIESGSPNPQFLMELCKTAAPYCHAKMHESKVSGALEIIHVPHVNKL